MIGYQKCLKMTIKYSIPHLKELSTSLGTDIRSHTMHIYTTSEIGVHSVLLKECLTTEHTGGIKLLKYRNGYYELLTQ
jgi:hypothetical protein